MHVSRTGMNDVYGTHTFWTKKAFTSHTALSSLSACPSPGSDGRRKFCFAYLQVKIHNSQIWISYNVVTPFFINKNVLVKFPYCQFYNLYVDKSTKKLPEHHQETMVNASSLPLVTTKNREQARAKQFFIWIALQKGLSTVFLFGTFFVFNQFPPHPLLIASRRIFYYQNKCWRWLLVFSDSNTCEPWTSKESTQSIVCFMTFMADRLIQILNSSSNTLHKTSRTICNSYWLWYTLLSHVC